MAADYTRTIVFKVEDQAIKRATGQIVASLKRIEKSLEKIEEKAFKQLVTDSGKVAENIDKAATALNKYNEELRKAQTQGKLSPFKSALAVREPGGALARTGGGAKRGGWRPGLGFGNLLGVSGAGITASTLAINSLTKQANNFTATLRQVPVVGDAIANKFNLVEHKVNGLQISLHAVGQVMQSHPLLAAGTAALLFAVGANIKDVTTAVWGLKNAFGATGKGMSNLLKTARNTSRGIKETLVGTFAGVSGSYGGPLNKGFVSGKSYSLGLREFLKPAKSATVDVFDIGKRSPYSKYNESRPASFRDLPYIDREAAEAKRFTDAAIARGLDPKQKEGLAERIERNIESSRMSRAGSGFSNWFRDTSGQKRANKFLTDRQKILRAIARQNAKLKKQGLEEISVADALNKKMRERLGITEQQGEWSYDERRRKMFTRDARFDRRERATQRLNRRKQGRFAERTGMNPKQAENLMLGFGFPMLFGGGIGAVGGGLGGAGLGNMIGMPGFGLQIMGSAIGTQLENLVMKANELGKALEEVDMTALEASGVKVSANLAEQVNDLRRIGDATRARYLLEVEAFKQTGAWPSANRNIKSTIDDLGNSWNRVSTTVGTLLGTLSGPFLGTLGTILDLVNEIAKVANTIFTLGDGIADGLFKLLGLEEQVARAKYEQSEEGKQALSDAKDKLSITIEQLAAEKKIRDIENSKSLGSTYADKIGNIGKDYQAAVEKIRSEQSKAKKDLLKNASIGYKLSGAYKTEIMNIDAVAGGKMAAAEDKRRQATRRVVYDYEKELNKQITDYTRQNDMLEKQLGIKGDIAKATASGNQYQAGQLQFDLQAIEIKETTKNVLSDIEEIEDKTLSKKLKQLVTDNESLKLKELAIQKSAQLTEAERKLEAVWDSIGVSIRDGLVEGINAAIDGTKTLGEVASNVFRKISNALLNYGINIGLSSLPGGVGTFFQGALGMRGIGGNKSPASSAASGMMDLSGAKWPTGSSSLNIKDIYKASGGPVSGGFPYIVGEKGPELFVPGSRGNIVPNHEMGGASVVVNVDASGSSVEGDEAQSRELGNMLAAAIQAELVRQKRPGGLLV